MIFLMRDMGKRPQLLRFIAIGSGSQSAGTASEPEIAGLNPAGMQEARKVDEASCSSNSCCEDKGVGVRKNWPPP